MSQAGDDSVRRFGMSTAALWGILLGTTVWLPVVLAVWTVWGGAVLWAFLLLATPYVAIIDWLLESHSTTPRDIWESYWPLALGTYAIYLWGLVELWTLRSGTARDAQAHAPWLVLLGAAGVVAGFIGLGRARCSSSV